MNKIVTSFLFATLFVILSSCGSSHMQENEPLASEPISKLTSITVTPAEQSIYVGSMQQFMATGTFSDGTTLDITNAVYWTVDDETIATIDETGLAVGVNVGAVHVAASMNRIDSAQAELTIIPAPILEEIVLTPENPSIMVGETQQFTAMGTYSDGSLRDITTMVTWHSRDGRVATISNMLGSQGLATAVGAGTTRIVATCDGIRSLSTQLTVTAPVTLESIVLDPLAPSIGIGETQQFTAKGIYSDGSTQDLTTLATWESSDTNVAKISNEVGMQGLATGMNPGRTKITATYMDIISGGAELKVFLVPSL